MKKIILILCICFTLIIPTQSAHAIDPKAKAFMVVCAYGTVGGALLGFASLSFGSNPRAIAQGASLGLYAGIIFGAYVLTSYNQKQSSNGYDNQPEDNGFYPTQPDPYYGNPAGPSPVDSGGAVPAPAPADNNGGFFGSGRVMEINEQSYRILNNKKERITPPVYINLLNMTF